MKREEFAEKRREMSLKSIVELIELLTSEDLQTRFFAEMCLRDQTNTWLNFKPASSREEREKAVEEWREWWKHRKGKFKKRWTRSWNQTQIYSPRRNYKITGRIKPL